MANYLHHDASNDFFLPLDNSAVFMASTTGKRSPYFFRVSCELDGNVFLPDLENALASTFRRFPFMTSRLRPGFFWYYLDPDDRPIGVASDVASPCEPPRRARWKVPLVRVRVHANRISCEFHHILTDGTGGLEFLRTLVASYLTLRGVECADWEDVKRPESPPEPAELEDAYAALYRADVPFPAAMPAAWHLEGKRFRGREYRITVGSFFPGEVLAAARSRGVTVTELLAAVYLSALQNLQELKRSSGFRPICVQVPVNMRKFHQSATLRNFFLFVPLVVDRRLGHYSFEDILARVHHGLRLGLDVRELSRQIKRNVRGERYLYSRIVPLILKNVFLRSIGKSSANAPFSGSISNLQVVRMPPAFAARITRFDLLPPRSDSYGACVGVASFGDTLSVTVGSRVVDSSFETEFFGLCAALGLRVTIATNRD